MKSCKDCVFLSVLLEVAGSRSKQVWANRVLISEAFMPIERSVYPYLPASIKAVCSRPSPTAAICATPSTASFMHLPHVSRVVSHVSANAPGTTFGMLSDGKAVG